MVDGADRGAGMCRASGALRRTGPVRPTWGGRARRYGGLPLSFPKRCAHFGNERGKSGIGFELSSAVGSSAPYPAPRNLEALRLPLRPRDRRSSAQGDRVFGAFRATSTRHPRTDRHARVGGLRMTRFVGIAKFPTPRVRGGSIADRRAGRGRRAGPGWTRVPGRSGPARH